MPPGIRPFTSSSEGRRTLSRMSAPATASEELAVIFAPAASKAASEKRDRMPALLATLTVHPSPTSFLAASGESATRVSPASSGATATVTMA